MYGDGDSIPASHAVEFFELLGDGQRDAGHLADHRRTGISFERVGEGAGARRLLAAGR